MKYKTLTDKESRELLNYYKVLVDLIDETHALSVKLLEQKYNEYVQNFNPKVLYIFTRTMLTFDEFVSGIDDLGHVSIKEFNGKKYLEVYYYYSARNIANVLKLDEKENELISTACNYGLDLYKIHNKYINRLIKYADIPYQFENDDFDKFDKYKYWSTEIKEVLDKYKAVP